MLDLAALKTMPIAKWAAADCHLFLWTTGPHLAQAIDLMAAWGFPFCALAFTWVKLRRRVNGGLWGEADLHVGLGYTTRHNAELVLLGRRGNPTRLSKNVRELVVEPLREHSRKPDEVYRRIEQYSRGPYLDLFARGSRPRWDVWGDQAHGGHQGVRSPLAKTSGRARRPKLRKHAKMDR